MSAREIMFLSVRSKTGASEVYSIQEYIQISPGCKGSSSNAGVGFSGAAAAACSPWDESLFCGEGVSTELALHL